MQQQNQFCHPVFLAMFLFPAFLLTEKKQPSLIPDFHQSIFACTHSVLYLVLPVAVEWLPNRLLFWHFAIEAAMRLIEAQPLKDILCMPKTIHFLLNP